jgi:asparagine synthase (glutamine-hydrolysing)
MCGFIAFKGDCLKYEKTLHLSHQSMKGRGLLIPSCQKVKKSESYFFGHNTLPIVSVDEREYFQPKFDQFPYVFAGEIFDYPKNDNRYLTDTDFIFKNIKEPKDLSIFHDYDGFWSGATITSNGSLFAYTDYLCQKPVYYRTDLNVVSSEPYALSLLDEERKFDPIFMSNILKWGYDPTGRTAWDKIKQIPPGCYYLDGVISSYWEWEKVNLESNDLYFLLSQSTKNRLTGKRKISILISGGLDSTIVHHLSHQELKTISLLHVENEESEYAKIISPDLEIIHPSNITQKEAIFIHQSPVDLGSVIPQLSLAKSLKKKEIKIVLTGDGADELFGGYRRINEYDSQYSDVFMELPYYHNPRLDRIMMSQTVELRTPFLSPKVIKYALSLPYEERKNKFHLKEIFKDKIPREIIERGKKPLKTNSIKNDLIKNTLSNIELFKVIYGR